MKLPVPQRICSAPPPAVSATRVRPAPPHITPILILFLAWLSCFSASALAEPSERKVELRLWHTWTVERREILESIIHEFNCRHENINVLALPFGPSGGSVAEQMLLGSATGRLPDLALVERESIPALADAGVISPLDKLILSSKARSGLLRRENLLDVAFAYAVYGRRLYGLPAYINPFVLIYNSEALSAEEGICAPPRDWDALIAAARTLAENTPGGRRRWVLSVRTMAPLFNILCVQRGVDICSTEDSAEDSAAVREIVDFIASLRQAPAMLPPQHKFWDPKFSGVASGKVLFQIDSATMLAHLAGNASVALSAAEVPSDSHPPRTYLSRSPVFVISSSGAKTRAALRFLEFFYSAEHYSRFAEQLLVVSPLKDAVSSLRDAALDRELYSQVVSAAENAAVFPLRRCSGTVMPRVARIVERLDAGLTEPERAQKQILEAAPGKECGPDVPSQEPIRVSWAESTRRLFSTAAPDLYRAPVRIVSSRNEHESFQLALSSARAQEGLTLHFAPFAAEAGKSAGIEMTARLEVDTFISKPLVGMAEGPYPNVLRPLGEFAVSPGSLTRIWVDTYVPGGTAAGEYWSLITVRRRGEDLAQVPVRLRVLPLDIPAAPSQPAVVGLNYGLVASYYGREEGSAAYRKLMDSFYWFLIKRRMSPLQPPVAIDSPELAAYMNDERVSACRLPISPANPRFRRAVAVADEGGWLNKLFAYFIDEPTYHQYKDIVGAGRMIHSMPARPKFLVTCFPEEPLIGAVDIWCIHLHFLPEGIPHGLMDRERYYEAVKGRMEAGDEVWWYTAGAVRPFPMLQIEDDPAAFRIIPWLQQMYRIGGFLHWETANWNQPFEEPFVKFFGNGEGVLLYPGDMQPDPSIRLELLREGLEDMEHLVLLRKRIEGLQETLGAERLGDAASVRVGELCRRLIDEEALRASASNGLFLMRHFVREPGRIEQAREEVVEETIDLANRPYALVLTEPEEKQYTESADARIYGVVERGCRVEINGRKAAVDKAGNFSARLPLSSGSNVFEVRLKKRRHVKVILRKIERF